MNCSFVMDFAQRLHNIVHCGMPVVVKSSQPNRMAVWLEVSFRDWLCVGDGGDDNIILKGNV